MSHINNTEYLSQVEEDLEIAIFEKNQEEASKILSSVEENFGESYSDKLLALVPRSLINLWGWNDEHEQLSY